MCSSASMPASGLNLGNHFLRWTSNLLKGIGIETTLGLFHGFWAIFELLTEESIHEVACGRDDDVKV